MRRVHPTILHAGESQILISTQANIQRIMRRLLPADEKISKDAKEVLQESLSRRGVRFVTFVTPRRREADAVAAQVRVRLLRHGRSRGPLRRAVWKSNLPRVRPESPRRPPRHRRDACSMAWRCRFLTSRRNQRGNVNVTSSPRNDLVKNYRAPDTLVGLRTGAEEKRKTINGDDLIFALQNLGFEEYVPPLQSYLAQYRRVSKQKEKE